MTKKFIETNGTRFAKDLTAKDSNAVIAAILKLDYDEMTKACRIWQFLEGAVSVNRAIA